MIQKLRMEIQNKVLLILKQNKRNPMIKTRLMALMYIIDENMGYTNHYTNNVGTVSVSIKSGKISNHLDRLDNSGYINVIEKITFGGGVRTLYRINESGIKEINNRDINQNTREIVSSVYNEYSEYPISNLLKDINTEYINS